MTFVQYLEYHKPWPSKPTKLVNVLGDRGVVILDGRNNISKLKKDAIELNGFGRPKYPAMQIYRGTSFCRSQPITDVFFHPKTSLMSTEQLDALQA